jgi:type IV secretion system protein VirB10
LGRHGRGRRALNDPWRRLRNRLDRHESALIQALRRGSQDSINQSGQQLVRRQINVQPTLTIRPGFPVRVLVNRDLVLAQYQG